MAHRGKLGKIPQLFDIIVATYFEVWVACMASSMPKEAKICLLYVDRREEVLCLLSEE